VGNVNINGLNNVILEAGPFIWRTIVGVYSLPGIVCDLLCSQQASVEIMCFNFEHSQFTVAHPVTKLVMILTMKCHRTLLYTHSKYRDIVDCVLVT
jgi:hypothetical protein